MKKILLGIFGGIVVMGVIFYFVGSNGLSDIKKMVISDVDLSKLDDGVYIGEFHKVRWNHDVEVTIRDHKITAIENTNKLPEANMKIVNGAIRAIVDKQSVKIDVISGATINTKAFQKAVENALTSGKRKQ